MPIGEGSPVSDPLMTTLGLTFPLDPGAKPTIEFVSLFATYISPLLSTAIPFTSVRAVFEPEITADGATFPFELTA